jgi:hypothetical protein
VIVLAELVRNSLTLCEFKGAKQVQVSSRDEQDVEGTSTHTDDVEQNHILASASLILRFFS